MILQDGLHINSYNKPAAQVINDKLSWVQKFNDAEKMIKAIAHNIESIHHIGSTAINDIYARQELDILIVLKNPIKPNKLEYLVKECLAGTLVNSSTDSHEIILKLKNNISCYLYLTTKDNYIFQRYTGFRDALSKNSELAKCYSIIKHLLGDQFSNDLKQYKNAKDSFIRKVEYDTGVACPMQLNAKDTIQLVAYDKAWSKLAESEISAIMSYVNLPIIDIQHVGSTAIPNLFAKPILDIFIAIENINDAPHWNKSLENLGYVFWEDNPDKIHHRYFKGMPPFGMQRTHHLHIMPYNQLYRNTVKFRDILIKDQNIKNKYLKLKQDLAKKYKNDREAYTNKKTKFIKSVLEND